MKKRVKVVFMVAALAVAACIAVSPVFADTSDKSFKEAAKSGAKATVNYPANLLNQSVNTVGTAAKNTADVIADTVKVTAETFTGDVKKAPEIVTTPVQGSAEAIRDAVVDTVETPIKAGQKTIEQD